MSALLIRYNIYLATYWDVAYAYEAAGSSVQTD